MKTTFASRQLRAFAFVAQHRNYTRAAETLRVTQSALTHSIQTLEGKLGVQLILMVRGDLQLTAPGRKILPHARAILREMAKIRAHADAAAAQKNAPIARVRWAA